LGIASQVQDLTVQFVVNALPVVVGADDMFAMMEGADDRFAACI
jgi:hypothetical protein